MMEQPPHYNQADCSPFQRWEKMPTPASVGIDEPPEGPKDPFTPPQLPAPLCTTTTTTSTTYLLHTLQYDLFTSLGLEG